jgi:lipopolysaccharide transport system permease protein
MNNVLPAATRDNAVPRLRAMMNDCIEAAQGWRAWLALAMMDIKHRYRRSVLGPLWITISMIVLITGIGTLYSVILRLELREYLPYIALGDIVWIYISIIMQDGCTAFTSSDNLIRSMRMPIMTHVMRIVTRNFIVFLHGAVAYIPFAIYLETPPEAIWLLALPGVIAIILLSIPLTAIFGLLSARYRDLQPAIANFMQLGFFLTPIIWKADMLGDNRWVADINPIYHFIQLVRAPIMGSVPEPLSYCVVAGSIFTAFAFAVLFVARNRHKIPYWV